jgi:hypothetical protein
MAAQLATISDTHWPAQRRCILLKWNSDRVAQKTSTRLREEGFNWLRESVWEKDYVRRGIWEVRKAR